MTVFIYKKLKIFKEWFEELNALFREWRIVTTQRSYNYYGSS